MTIKNIGIAVLTVVLFVIFFVILHAFVASTPVASTPVASTPVASTPVASTPVVPASEASIVPTNWKGYGYSTNGRCGPSYNNTACPDNKCCSTYGYCGLGDLHCAQVGTPAASWAGSISNGRFNDLKPTWSTE